MSNVAIRVEGLGKRYRIGAAAERHDNLRAALTHVVKAPLRNLQRLRRLNTFGDGEDSDTIWALRDVGFEVAHGEVLGIIGRNGAGKSTLLKILSRITEPTTGRAELHGRVGALLEVGTGFHPELTGRENVYLNGSVLGMNRRYIDRRFDEIVEFAGVDRFIDTPVKRYSSGMYLRLAFSVAAHLEPEILVVDEVLAVGDADFQKKCIGKMGEVAGEGRTVLFVSHNMGAITRLCHRAVHIDEGRMLQIAQAEKVVASYLSAGAKREVHDLGRLRLPNYGQQVRFSHLAMSGDSVLRFGDPIQFLFRITANTAFNGLSVGGSIFNMHGMCVGTLFTRERFSVRPERDTTLELTIAGPDLAPGHYYAGFSIGRGGGNSGRHDLDVVIGAPQFEVSAFSADAESSIVHWNPNWGSVVLRNVHLREMESECVS